MNTTLFTHHGGNQPVQFNNILYVLNPGQNAIDSLDWLIAMARENHARITLMDIISEMPAGLRDLESPLAEMRHAQLREMVSSHDSTGVPIDYLLADGVAFIEVIRQVISSGHDLLVKEAEYREIQDSEFGTTDMHLLRKCPCPVWILHPQHPRNSRSVLAAIDVDPEKPANEKLNAQILDLAVAHARQHGARLHVAHAWGLPNEVLLRDKRFNMSFDMLEGFVDDTRRQREQLVDEAVMSRELLDIDFELHMQKTSAAELISQLTISKQVDLVVMGTVARTGIAGFFIGNTAEKVARNIHCSLLTVKPDGFVSPVSISS
jgi:nucleotide-binding universal stress UspA family protein